MKKLSKQITLGTDPYTGKRIRKRIYADSQTGLKQAEKQILQQYARTGTENRILYDNYERRWFAASCSQLSPHTQYCYEHVLKKMDPVRYMRMDKITRLDLQKIINDSWKKPDMCYKIVGLMRQIWKSALIDGIINKNITEGLKRPKRAKSARRALTEAELTAIKEVDLTERERFFVDVMLQFGLRPGEAMALNRMSFNRENRTLTIDKAISYKNMKEPFIKSTKTGVTRVLPVPDSFWQKIPKTKTIYYFAKKNGELLSRGGALDFQKTILKKINRQMGGTNKLKATDMTMYTFRHNKASLLYYMPGISLKKKAEYMGHSETMFLQTYSHLIESNEDVELLRQAVV